MGSRLATGDDQPGISKRQILEIVEDVMQQEIRLQECTYHLDGLKIVYEFCMREHIEDIKQEYRLGSKELSNALNLIKEHRLFSTNIGCEKIFGTVTEDELKEYASLVKCYEEKDKSKVKAVTEWYRLQQKSMLRRNLSIRTRRVVLDKREKFSGQIQI